MVALAGAALGVRAQSETPREWKSRRGAIVVFGTLDVEKTDAEFAEDAEKPENVYFRGKDGKCCKRRYLALERDAQKRGDVALGLVAEVVDEESAPKIAMKGGVANVDETGGYVGKALGVVAEKRVRRALLVGVELRDLKFAGADVELTRKRLVENLGFEPENIVAITTEAGRQPGRAAYAPAATETRRRLNLCRINRSVFDKKSAIETFAKLKSRAEEAERKAREASNSASTQTPTESGVARTAPPTDTSVASSRTELPSGEADDWTGTYAAGA